MPKLVIALELQIYLLNATSILIKQVLRLYTSKRSKTGVFLLRG